MSFVTGGGGGGLTCAAAIGGDNIDAVLCGDITDIGVPGDTIGEVMLTDGRLDPEGTTVSANGIQGGAASETFSVPVLRY